jgi:hypothetical protein
VGIGGMSISVARMVDLIDCTEMGHSFDALCSRRSSCRRSLLSRPVWFVRPFRGMVAPSYYLVIGVAQTQLASATRGIPALIGASCQQSSSKAARCVWLLTNSTFSDLCFGKSRQPVFSCTENVCL